MDGLAIKVLSHSYHSAIIEPTAGLEFGITVKALLVLFLKR